MFFMRQPKEPAERIDAALVVLREQHLENNQRGIGLMHMPRHQRAKADLVRMGPAAVPKLIEVLEAHRASADTPNGRIDDGVASDVAEVLGDIGDRRAIGPLLAQFKRHIVSAQGALAKFPAGVDALLHGLGDPDEFIRGCCVCGLGVARVERCGAVRGITKALADPHAANRREACLAARHLAVRDAELIDALRQLSVGDPSERVREMAGDALWELDRGERAQTALEPTRNASGV
jgi:HEAT repeat protein